jgi:hypothetical protein
MKKIYLILLAISFLYNAKAQSLIIQNANNILQDTAGFFIIEGTATVVNISSSTKDVMMYRKINNLAPGHISAFCWGINCYAPFTDTSVYPVSMPSNDSALARADLLPMDSAGYSEVAYCWYDLNNPADSVCLLFTYDILPGLTGINELDATGGFVSSPHPNPADLFTVLFYSLKNYDADAEIILYNMMGSKVLEMKLDHSKHDVRLNTAFYPQGVYYYSLISGGRVASTNKLIVAH